MWKFVLRDLSGQAIGELWNASDRELVIPLNGLPTASFKVRNDHPFADPILDGDLLVSVYEGKTLRFNGELVTSEEVVSKDEQSIRVNALGMLWRLQKRLTGKSTAGATFGTPAAQLDRGEIARQLLVAANAEANTGIRVGDITASSLTYVYEPPWRVKPISEAISELSSAMDGFDFKFAPVEPTVDASGLHLATMYIAAALGQDRPNCAFEYGDGKRNISEWKRSVDRSGLMNAGYNVPPLNSAEPMVSREDAASIAARGRYEGVVEGSVASPQLRQALTDENVRVRKLARQIVTFTPAVDAYVYGQDFEVGDTVRVRAKVKGVERLNVAVRVYGVTWKDSPRGDMAISDIETVNEALFS